MITNTHIGYLNLYLLSCILFVTSYLVFGCYYGTSDDATVEALIRGVFFSHPVTEFFAFHRITAILYSRLYQLFPNIPWYGVIMYILLFLAVTNYLMLIHRHAKKLIANDALLSPLLIVFYLIFFLDAVIFITFTKVAILLAASSILLIIDGTLHGKEVQFMPYRRITWWYFLLFIIAVLTRPHAGILCVLLLLPFAFLYKGSKDCLVRTVCGCVALISVVGLLKLYDIITWTEGSRYYWSVSPYVLNIYDFNREGKNLDAPQDAMKYRAVMSGALGDRAIINESFLAKVSNNQTVEVDRLHPREFARGIKTIAAEMSLYHMSVLFAITAIALLVLITRRRDLPFTYWASFSTFTVFYWSVVISIAAFLKMPDRVLSPVVLTYIVTCLLFITAFLGFPNGKLKQFHAIHVESKIVGWIWVASFVLAIFGGYKKMPQARMAANEVAKTLMIREAINTEIKGKIVVFTFNASQEFLTHQPIFSVVRLSANNQYLLVDGTWPTLLPDYPQRLKEVTGSDQLSEVFEFLLKNRDNVIFVSTAKRNALITDYFATIYNRKYSLKEFEKTRLPTEIQLYTIDAAAA